MRPAIRIMAHSESVGIGATPRGGSGSGIGSGPGTAGPGPPLQAVTAFPSSVTAPFRASVRPFRVAPVFIVMLVSARMFPAMALVVPTVAELVTCHQTPHAEAPFSSRIDEAVAVVSELPDWMM